MKNIFYYIISIVAVVFFFVSCTDSDDYSSDSNLKLSFSKDLVDFDTVFSEVGSATKQFKIYNQNKNSLSIESIQLMNASKSGFRINIDGESGSTFNNVRILKKDSLFAFVQIKVDPFNTNNPVVIRDSIRFSTNGNTQYIYLEAIGQNVYMWKGKVISEDTTLPNDKPFLITDSLVIKENANVVINEGSRFFFKRSASLQIHGTVDMKGSSTKPIILSGERFDNITENIPYDNVSGQWDGVFFYKNSFNNHLKNVVVKNSVIGIDFQESSSETKKAILESVIVQNTSANGVSATNCDIDARNCLFANSRGATFMVMGGKYSFVHCTFANYYRWAGRQRQAMVISNISNKVELKPLYKCDVTNSIVYGSVSKELLLDYVSTGSFEYKFENCLIKATETNSPNFINTIWNIDPQFKDINSSGIYSYDFDLQSISPAIDKANDALSLPYDLGGRNRPYGIASDIGCYEWIPTSR